MAGGPASGLPLPDPGDRLGCGFPSVFMYLLTRALVELTACSLEMCPWVLATVLKMRARASSHLRELGRTYSTES